MPLLKHNILLMPLMITMMVPHSRRVCGSLVYNHAIAEAQHFINAFGNKHDSALTQKIFCFENEKS